MTASLRVLVATELSADGINTVRRAALLAHERGARLHLLHTLEAPGRRPLRDAFCPGIDLGLRAALARRALQRMALDIASTYDIVPTVEVVIGDPQRSLAQGAAQADLVVLGQRGPGLLQAWATGRAVVRLLKSCRRPVLVVKTPAQQPYRRILLPIAFTGCSDAAVRVTAGLQGEAGVQVFHAVDPHRYAMLRDADVPEPIIREARALEEAGLNARMRRRVARLGLHGAALSFALRHGPAANATLRQAQALGADLIVTGRLERSGWDGLQLLHGSVSRRILSGSSCDVLVVPSPLAGALSPAAPPPQAPVPVQAPAEAATTGHWVHNTAGFLRRRSA